MWPPCDNSGPAPGAFPQILPAMMKLPLLLLLGACSLSACAQTAAPPAARPEPLQTAPGTAAARVQAALKAVDPKIELESIADAPIPGFQQVIAGGQVIYISNDARYLMQGPLYDIGAKQDLSDAAMAKVRLELLKQIPAQDRIVFAPANPKHTVTVFTDIECGYCRKLHAEMAEYNKLGIAVEYTAFPRGGLNSPDYEAMVSVWCSADRRKALTEAKAGSQVQRKTCDNPVAKQYALGQRMGLRGTPMIITAQGRSFAYVPPRELREQLDKLASQASAGKPPGA